MEPTIEQVLQRGITAHQEGKLQEAERLYRLILKTQPQHPDANHNLGLIAVSVDQAAAALPLFKVAVEANPKIEQFWLAYIDALIRAQQFETAQQVITEGGGENGVAAEKLNALQAQLASMKKSENVNSAGPSQAQLNTLLELYKNGRYDEAEKLALSLTQEFSEHPFGWKVLGAVLKHTGRMSEALAAIQKSVQLSPQDAEALNNLGSVLQGLGRLEEAATSCSQAIALKPDYAEAHYSLGNTLKKMGRLDEAAASYRYTIMLEPDYAEVHNNLGITLKELGRFDEATASYRQAIVSKPTYAEAQYNLGNMLQEFGKLDEAEASYTRAIVLKSDYAEAYNNLGITLQELGRLEEAEESYAQAIVLKSDYAEAYSNLGVTLQERGRFDEAEKSNRQAIALKPDFAEAYNNLSSTLKELGRLDEAVASLRQAIALNPGYAEAYSNLGNTLQELGRLDEAEASYTQAFTMKPDYAEAHYNLGVLLGQRNDLEGAIDSYWRAIDINPSYVKALVNLGNALDGVRFKRPRSDLIPVVEIILDNRAGGRPKSVAKASISLLKFESWFKAVAESYSSGRFDRGISEIISVFAESCLLLKLMSLCPLPDRQVENFLTTIRAEILLSLSSISTSPELLKFQQALALQCFINEYIYECSDEESEVLKTIEQEVEATLRSGQQPDPIMIACLASYRALYQYDWCQLLVLPEDLFELGQRQIQEPLDEKRLRTELPILQEITNKVSSLVRDQYEQHPYPRWVKCNQHPNPISIKSFAKSERLSITDTLITDVSAPSILIAGCGTGQQSIEVATTFKDCHVLAIDLSISSLAYAQRKTTEMGITNIEYMQADILDLGKLGRQFDVIESAGVLHHMDDPMAGWRVLTDCLKPGGLMKIGLYSEIARQHIVQIRDEIQELGLQPNESDMKWFRKTILDSDKQHHRLIIKSADLYSLSSYRDLLFHVQEHRFTIPQIQNGLATLGLQFSGFGSSHFIPGFRQSNPNVEDLYDLSKWQAYEENSLGTFAGMYQFWCQRAHD